MVPTEAKAPVVASMAYMNTLPGDPAVELDRHHVDELARRIDGHGVQGTFPAAIIPMDVKAPVVPLIVYI